MGDYHLQQRAAETLIRADRGSHRHILSVAEAVVVVVELHGIVADATEVVVEPAGLVGQTGEEEELETVTTDRMGL